jgi:AraC family transcriptional regulator
MVLYDPVVLNQAREAAVNSRQIEVESEMKPLTAEAGGRSAPTSNSYAGLSTNVLYILDSIRRNGEHDPEAACTAAKRLVTLLSGSAGVTLPGVRGGLAPWQKRKLDQYINENLPQLHRVDDLAQQVSLSVSHFYRAFRQTFGLTPRAYILRLKLDRAKVQMLETEDSLAQIAVASGFADQSHFSKLFRRAEGDTPAAWRRRSLARAAS